MIDIGFIVIALLIAALVLFILGFFIAPRQNIWIGAVVCAVLALVIRVFAGG